MQYLFLDFETYYDSDYSLRKMTPLEYALDPRFEAIGCAFADVHGYAWWVDGPDLQAYFDSLNWREIYAVSHNALFDMIVLAVRYDAIPGKYGDTLAMARNQLAHILRSLSLESIVGYYGMPPKHTDTLARMKGVNFQMLEADPALYEAEVAYGKDDVLKCREIFGRLLQGGFPPGELDVVDLVVRMAAVPQFELDGVILAEHLAKVRADKQALLDAAGVTDDNLTPLLSDQQFAIKLWYLGVRELPRKLSKTTGKEQYAFAKTDKAFTALLEHPNPRVQTLVAARLGVKSTLEESRTERLLSISRLTTAMPIPLKYSGAHTHRFGGDWKINEQNLPNGSDLRKAHKAPKGKKVVSIDASQIEARLNAVLSGQNDLVEDFRNGVDVYSKFAEEDIYHYPIDKGRNKQERFVGKQGILSLGYGSSPPVFQNMVRVKSDPAKPIILQDAEAISIVYLYRQRFKRIVENWRYAGNVVIPRLALGETHTGNLLRETVDALAGVSSRDNPSLVPWGPLVIEKNRIVGPNGNCLYYPDLHQEQTADGPRWLFKRADRIIHLYGAKLVENVIQFLAFIHIMDVAKRVHEDTNGYLWPAHQVHDELVYVVDEQLAEQVGELVVKEMSRSPWWMPAAPLAAEAHIGDSYGDLK